jgi:hypothetical protein
MARVKQNNQYTGTIGGLSHYTRKGSDEIFVRRKGGATKDQIKRRPEFENTRRNNKEFGGCSKMSKAIRVAFFGLHHVADYNLAPALCSLMKNIQRADTEGAWGERSILLSQYKQYLVGFNFNRITRFDSVLRIPLDWKIDRENTSATVTIPEFACSLGLSMYEKHRLFRISACLGVVTDLVFNERNKEYEPVHDTIGLGRRIESTAWFTTSSTVNAQTLEMKLDLTHPEITFNASDTLILVVAVEFGAYDDFGKPMEVKGAGAGKVIGVG